jgi:K+ transporter
MSQKANSPTHPDSTLPVGRSGLAALGLAALGIVFGDIGTSPLYTLKTVLSVTKGTPTPDVVIGVLSLIVWTLIIITSVKYVVVGAVSFKSSSRVGLIISAGNESEASREREFILWRQLLMHTSKARV